MFYFLVTGVPDRVGIGPQENRPMQISRDEVHNCINDNIRKLFQLSMNQLKQTCMQSLRSRDWLALQRPEFSLIFVDNPLGIV